ncbi:FIST N-terminal domain-containing protein [Serpentinicella alkaliphila]|uniref:FIST-like protein n=1 Tax=Serpentinicella alkaliphila TaxID=1734049 RepID=A0A4R2TVD8_9FIRM|nr:FIST N-terminal domain-containing protein [Serpentinicella alkaliphila]QUH25479.1 hypothetical protein HZR23_06670 [Serpentinicella alkaliphila]TCQ01599.1 FIST-like protein [Serpentinicella alkaliphila]
MKQEIINVNNLEDIKHFLSQKNIYMEAQKSKSTLVQVYSSNNDITWYTSVVECILGIIPNVYIVGASTVGEIIKGKTSRGETVIALSFFELTEIKVIAEDCSKKDEADCGFDLGKQLESIKNRIAGIQLLTTPLSINTEKLLKGLRSYTKKTSVFGGGAGDYYATSNTIVIAGRDKLKKGIVAVAYIGEDLLIETCMYLG